MKKFIFIVSLFILLTSAAQSAHAADCVIIYGGGQTECVKGMTVTPASSKGGTSPTQTPTPTTPPPANQSKGGLPIQPQPESKAAPATGPESLALISLISMATAGMWLRRKTKLH